MCTHLTSWLEGTGACVVRQNQVDGSSARKESLMSRSKERSAKLGSDDWDAISCPLCCWVGMLDYVA